MPLLTSQMILSLSSLLIFSFNKYSFSTKLAKNQVMVSKTILISRGEDRLEANHHKLEEKPQSGEESRKEKPDYEEELTWQSLRCGRK